jgi:hypothetical protein
MHYSQNEFVKKGSRYVIGTRLVYIENSCYFENSHLLTLDSPSILFTLKT